MSSKERCEVAGCGNAATRITSTESKYILVCEKCFDEKYRP